MAEFGRVAIIGVGLLGGSIGLALKKRRLAERVVGLGRHPANLKLACECGAIDQAETSLEAGCRDAELVVICTPVQLVPELARQCAPYIHSQGWMTDVGSTKATIVEALNDNPQFCGSHPLAGSDKSGVAHADPELFEGKTAIITPGSQTPEETCDRTESFWRSLGCQTVRMHADKHDRAVAMTSHLPHVVAAALAAATPSELLPLAASGWCDTTRIAGGSVEMWVQILQDNRSSVLAALKGYQAQLSQWTAALESQDEQQLASLLELGKRSRDSLGN